MVWSASEGLPEDFLASVQKVEASLGRTGTVEEYYHSLCGRLGVRVHPGVRVHAVGGEDDLRVSVKGWEIDLGTAHVLRLMWLGSGDIHELSFTDCDASPEAAAVLRQGFQAQPQISRLTLDGSQPLVEPFLKDVSDSRVGRLVSLVLRYVTLSDKVVGILTDILRRLAQCNVLVFHKCQLTEAQALDLAAGLYENTSLRWVDFSGNPEITSKTMRGIIENFADQTVDGVTLAARKAALAELQAQRKQVAQMRRRAGGSKKSARPASADPAMAAIEHITEDSVVAKLAWLAPVSETEGDEEEDATGVLRGNQGVVRLNLSGCSCDDEAVVRAAFDKAVSARENKPQLIL